jgi:predicted dehydrogenase
MPELRFAQNRGAVIRTAVVGLGAVALEHLKRLSVIAGVNVVAACDLSATLARAVAERFPLVRPYDNYARMLEEHRPDVVHVLAPPQAHLDLTLAALEGGAHVFVEKPIAPTLEDYVRMRDTALERGLLLCENYNYRFGRGVQKAFEVVRSGALGDVVNVDVWFDGVMAGPAYMDTMVPHFAHALPGGALQNFISHPVSIALPLIGDCTGAFAVERSLDGRFQSNDELRALLRGDDACAAVTVSRNTLPRFELAIAGTRGRTQVDVYAGRVTLDTVSSSAEALPVPQNGTVGARRAPARRDAFEGLGTLLTRFYEAIAGRAAAPISVGEMDAVNTVVAQLLTPAYVT